MVNIGILGTGNMGQALAGPWIKKGLARVLGYDRDLVKLEQAAQATGLVPVTDPLDLIKESDFLVLAVKPQQVERVLKGLVRGLEKRGPKICLLSIAAGISVPKLKKWSGEICPVVRVMPNTPALVGQGVFALCLEDQALNSTQAGEVQELFAALGQVHVLAEGMFDAYTALIGSGPAYVFYVLESLIEAGVLLGFTRDQATDMVKGLLTGSAKLAEQSPLTITQLREMVTSPAGTTIAALHHLDRKAVRAAFMDALVRARDRSRELG